MKVYVNQVPEDGKHFEGEEPSDVLGLSGEGARAVSPIRYSLDVGLSEGGLFATGDVSVDVECECVRCLTRFQMELGVPDFACQIELDKSGTVDLTEYLREDILLVLPAHPHCDWSGENVCKADFTITESESTEPIEEPRDVWKALENIQL